MVINIHDYNLVVVHEETSFLDKTNSSFPKERKKYLDICNNFFYKAFNRLFSCKVRHTMSFSNTFIYSKTCLIWHLGNRFPCLNWHWFPYPFDHFVYVQHCNKTPCLYWHKISLQVYVGIDRFHYIYSTCTVNGDDIAEALILLF